MGHLFSFISISIGLGVHALMTVTPFDTKAMLWVGFAILNHRVFFKD